MIAELTEIALFQKKLTPFFTVYRVIYFYINEKDEQKLSVLP